MNKQEFLRVLELLLQDIPKEEREEALRYYRGYFEDAGIENEQSIIEELGSPQKVAEAVKADFSTPPVVYEEPEQEEEKKEKESVEFSNHFTGKSSDSKSENKKGNKTGRTAIIIICIILAIPLIFAGGFHIFGLLFSILGVILGLTVSGLVGVGVSIFIIVRGAMISAISMGSGVFLIGIGILGTVISVILFVGVIKVLTIVIPFVFRKIKQLFRYLKRKIGGQ